MQLHAYIGLLKNMDDCTYSVQSNFDGMYVPEGPYKRSMVDAGDLKWFLFRHLKVPASNHLPYTVP